MFSYLKTLFSWRSRQMENRGPGNMLPTDTIDLTGDDEVVDMKNESQPVMVCAPCVDFMNYKCPICILHPLEPVSTLCGHVFCKQCLRNSLDSGIVDCPICKSILNEEKIIRLHI
ncbi:hypothetical protein KR074_006005 [Drosophila pseudoananassae]|nr:hypothetical protein KR074_006005 [Drosophila pseudoananassae]